MIKRICICICVYIKYIHIYIYTDTYMWEGGVIAPEDRGIKACDGDGPRISKYIIAGDVQE